MGSQKADQPGPVEPLDDDIGQIAQNIQGGDQQAAGAGPDLKTVQPGNAQNPVNQFRDTGLLDHQNQLECGSCSRQFFGGHEGREDGAHIRKPVFPSTDAQRRINGSAFFKGKWPIREKVIPEPAFWQEPPYQKPRYTNQNDKNTAVD